MKPRSDRTVATKIRWVLAIYGILMVGIFVLVFKQMDVL